MGRPSPSYPKPREVSVLSMVPEWSALCTGDRYVIEDINKTQHDGNYSLVVSNDFGSVTTQPTQLVVDGTPTTHTVPSANNLEMIFCPTFILRRSRVDCSEETQHQVTLTNGFYLGKYEVTQAYETVMNNSSDSAIAPLIKFHGKSFYPD